MTPAGTSVALGGIGADALGRSGQTGQVDIHFRERFGSAALISIFGLAPQFAVNDETDEDVAVAIDAMGGDLESASRSALDAYLRIAPPPPAWSRLHGTKWRTSASVRPAPLPSPAGRPATAS